MGNYTNLNVINNKNNRLIDNFSDDTIDQIANMVKATGKNRSQRRRLEKSLGKMQTILEHSQKHLDKSAYKEYQAAVDLNFTQFFSILAITMVQDYHWKEDESHDQVSSLLERVNHKIDKYNIDGRFDTEAALRDCEELTGLILMPDEH